MPPVLTPQAFVAKWEKVTLNEKAVAQSHFNELCQLLGQPTPTDADPTGGFYRFEKPLTKVGGGGGFADVWKRDAFAWEYKTKGKYHNLDDAYKQLLLYRADLDNPPVLVACDIASYEIHIEFTGHKTRVERFTNADLINAETRDLLRLVLTDPERLRPSEKTFGITEQIAAEFAQSATWVEKRGYEPHRVAHFFMKLLFSMFAEDIGLLPNYLLRHSIHAAILKPAEFEGRTRTLFRAMHDGGYFGHDHIRQFNGGLFDDDDVIPLTAAELEPLMRAARQNWQDVEPVIFGTLFERSLDPGKRAQLGAHYTSKEDILLLVEPVLMQPLSREWAETCAEIEALRPAFDAATGAAKQRQRNQIEQKILAFMERLSNIRVLDPACGSGNFLYVALNTLKDLEKEVITYAVGIGLEAPEQGVGPHQLFGIERNPFAAELAQVVVWIGNLQWNSKNGYWEWPTPVLQTLHTIECRDAILTYDEHGKPVEPEWPEVDVIIGNPPFLGGKRLRTELGDGYVDRLFALYDGRVPREADLVTYWFERARALIEDGNAKRVGLLATQAIRAGANRKVLSHIKQTGDIFYAQSDRPWILDGASVRVSMVGFDNGTEATRERDGIEVQTINADLTSTVNLTTSQRLVENMSISYMGDTKVGPFEIDYATAQKMLEAPLNMNHRPNSDVIHPWANGLDVTGRSRNMWIIDFGVGTEEETAALYELPFEYIKRHVKPFRAIAKSGDRTGVSWWLHQRPRPDMRNAIGICIGISPRPVWQNTAFLYGFHPRHYQIAASIFLLVTMIISLASYIHTSMKCGR
jgi:hypothetical protein